MNNKYFLLVITFFIFLVITILNFCVERVRGKAINYNKPKRGYILDRNLSPIALSIENYQIYYVFKNDSFLNQSDFEILKKYLNATLNLPEKGVILLSNNVSLEEVENLKDKKNIIIKTEYERKILQPYLRFLIGEVCEESGVTGLEKIFDNRLRKGKSVILSLDLHLEKKIYNLIHKYNILDCAIGVFDLETGEVLGYLDLPNTALFNFHYPLFLFNIPPKEIKNFSWELGNEILVKKGDDFYITIWQLAKWYMDNICSTSIVPTILYTKIKKCSPELEKLDKKEYTYIFNNTLINVRFKKNKMLIANIVFSNSTDEEAIKKFINSLYSTI